MQNRTARAYAVKRQTINSRKTIEGVVHNPLGHDTNVVIKIYDPLIAMQKRKQITADQYQAAQRLQFAYETVYGQAGGSMDFDRSRGSGAAGQPPAQPYMVASETLRLAKQWLYPKDYAVVFRVCIQGIKISDCGHLFDDGREGKLEAGRALKRGLGVLSDKWGYSSMGRKNSPSYFREAESTVEDIPVVRGNSFVMS